MQPLFTELLGLPGVDVENQHVWVYRILYASSDSLNEFSGLSAPIQA